ncbi:Anti-sigma-B factor antagonist [Actinomadura sp. RB99]|uniref:STAS domain-containing protein n=1 Tax=Actinomadura sp. RB99 TaxID=2691577 RepID=UPI0019A85B6F|nr:Anti-sigma-B factor antagonist [Actinomadura sp. RB99]
MDFNVHRRRYGDQTIVAVSGDVDVGSSPGLRVLLLGLVEDGARRLVIDLDGATFLDSTGLGVFIGVSRRLGALNGELVFAGGPPGVREVFDVTHLARVFDMYGTVEQAVARRPGGVRTAGPSPF